jgi:dihydroxy-acid dehydratase
VLHVSPESAIGGPLALVRTGDLIKLDTAGRRIDVLIDAAELDARRRAWQAPAPRPEDSRSYRKLFLDSVEQAEHGCDFAFLKPPVRTRTPIR